MSRRDWYIAGLLTVVIGAGLFQGKLDTTSVALALIALFGGSVTGIIARRRNDDDDQPGGGRK